MVMRGEREIDCSTGLTRLLKYTFPVLLLLIGFLSGCAPLEIYRAYSGSELPDASLATVELKYVNWARFDDQEIDGRKYRAVKLLPGVHHIEWQKTFGVSFLVDPRMFAKYKKSATVTLMAGHTYRLRAERTYGPGYVVFFWIEDAATGNVVWGSKKP